jgi:hypothetical protein
VLNQEPTRPRDWRAWVLCFLILLFFFFHCVGGAWKTEFTAAAMEKGAGGGEGEARRKLGNSSVVAAGSSSLQQMGAKVKETYLDIVPIASREPDIGSSFQVSFFFIFLLAGLGVFVCLFVCLFFPLIEFLFRLVSHGFCLFAL